MVTVTLTTTTTTTTTTTIIIIITLLLTITIIISISSNKSIYTVENGKSSPSSNNRNTTSSKRRSKRTRVSSCMRCVGEVVGRPLGATKQRRSQQQQRHRDCRLGASRRPHNASRCS